MYIQKNIYIVFFLLYNCIMGGDKMDENILIRLSSDEKEKIKEDAKGMGMNISQYIRYILIYKK